MEIRVMKNIFEANQKTADENRLHFKERKITAVNVMASPGAGKTSLILKIAEAMKDKVDIRVIEGDIASSIDSEIMERQGIPVIQINTGGGCHLDAYMIKQVEEDLGVKERSLLFIENVGNLVCPSEFDLGEGVRMVIASVPEGHDKPYKYVSMFESADVVVLNKTDLLPYVNFDRESFYRGIKALNPRAPVFEVSCTTGEGVRELLGWLEGILYWRTEK